MATLGVNITAINRLHHTRNNKIDVNIFGPLKIGGVAEVGAVFLEVDILRSVHQIFRGIKSHIHFQQKPAPIFLIGSFFQIVQLG